MDLTHWKVRIFLEKFKVLANDGRILIVKRNKDYTSLGLTYNGCILELLELSVEDYSSGPAPDRGGDGDVWIFGKVFNGKEAYIKLKISVDGEKEVAVCISFHPAEHSIYYPFKK